MLIVYPRIANFVLKMEDINQEINNLRYLYKESGCKTWKEFAERYRLNYQMLSRWNRHGRRPNEETISDWIKKFGVASDYFEQERPYLPMEDLDYGHHLEHHVEVKYSLDEFIDACKVAEDIDLDRHKMLMALYEKHR